MLGRNFVSGLVCLAITSANSSPTPTKESTVNDPHSSQITTTTFETTFATSSKTCTNTIDGVQESLKKGDAAAVYSSVESFHSTVKTIQATVEQSEFHPHSSVTYSATVAEVVVTYGTVVSTLSNHPSVEKGCHDKLKEIKVSVQKIVNVYAEAGVCVKDLVEKNGGIDNVRLEALDLQLNLVSFEAKQENQIFKVPDDDKKGEGEDQDSDDKKDEKEDHDHDDNKNEVDHDHDGKVKDSDHKSKKMDEVEPKEADYIGDNQENHDEKDDDHEKDDDLDHKNSKVKEEPKEINYEDDHDE